MDFSNIKVTAKPLPTAGDSFQTTFEEGHVTVLGKHRGSIFIPEPDGTLQKPPENSSWMNYNPVECNAMVTRK